MSLVRLFPRFGNGRTEPALVGDGVMPDLQKFGIQAAHGLVSQDGSDASSATAPDASTDGVLRVVLPVGERVSIPMPVEELQSSGDPVLDQVLRSRREARERLRVLRKELLQERRRLADITAFVRPRGPDVSSPTIEEGSVEAK